MADSAVCMDMCMVYRHVYGHVYGHGHGHVYGHVYRNVPKIEMPRLESGIPVVDHVVHDGYIDGLLSPPITAYRLRCHFPLVIDRHLVYKHPFICRRHLFHAHRRPIAIHSANHRRKNATPLSSEATHRQNQPHVVVVQAATSTKSSQRNNNRHKINRTTTTEINTPRQHA